MDQAALELDPDQRLAVAVEPGTRRVVLGGPGTGKTVTAIELIARHLEAGGDISRVLALTSSRSTAASLRDRLAARTSRTSAGPLARSVASLAHTIVTRSSMQQHRRPPVLLSGGDEDAAWQRFLSADAASADGIDWPDHLGPEVRALPEFRAELREFIARLTERGETPDSFAARASASAHAELWGAAAAAWHRFEEALQPSAAVPVVTLSTIVRSAAAIMRSRPEPEFDLVVVDDAQELTAGGLDLVLSLAGGEQPLDPRQRSRTALVLLGCTDTTAGVFRGAQPGLLRSEPLQYFERLDLTRQHRFGRAVADRYAKAVHLVGVSGSPAERTFSVDERVESSAVAWRASGGEQARLIADTLRERRLLDGVPWSELAVVVRTSALARELSGQLAALDVPVATAGALPWRHDPAVQPLTLLLSIASGARALVADDVHALLASPYFDVDALQWRRLRRALRAALAHAAAPETVDDWLVEAVQDPDRVEALLAGGGIGPLATRALESVLRLGRVLAAAAELADSAPGPALWEVWSALGVADAWYEIATGEGPDAELVDARLDAVLALFRQADIFSERYPDRGVRPFVADWLASSVDDDSIATPEPGEAVIVGTPLSFVSREFDTVVVAGVADSVWPNLKLRSSLLRAEELVRGASDRQEVKQDEARLFALALSRARSSLVVVAEESEHEQASAFLAMLEPEAAPERMSTSLTAIVSESRRVLTSAAADDDAKAQAAAVLRHLADRGVHGADPSQWYGTLPPTTETPLGDPAATPRISPSKIEEFETCEVEWAVKRLAGESVGTARSIGTIVHGAVEHARSFTVGEMLEHIDRLWPQLEFEAPWEGAHQHEVVEHMVERLEQYFSALAADGFSVDRDLREASLEVELDGAVLTGFIDWIERGPEGVRISDLKTGGKAVTKSEALEHPQLLAYQLAVARGGISRVRPGTEVLGARLIYPKSDTVKVESMVREQPPYGADRLDAFAAAVADAARRMAAATFETVPERHCLQSNGYIPECRIQVTKQVTE